MAHVHCTHMGSSITLRGCSQGSDVYRSRGTTVGPTSAPPPPPPANNGPGRSPPPRSPNDPVRSSPSRSPNGPCRSPPPPGPPPPPWPVSGRPPPPGLAPSPVPESAASRFVQLTQCQEGLRFFLLCLVPQYILDLLGRVQALGVVRFFAPDF